MNKLTVGFLTFSLVISVLLSDFAYAMSYEDLVALIKQENIVDLNTTIKSLVQLNDPQDPWKVAFIYDSHGIQQATKKDPRVLLFQAKGEFLSKVAKFIVAYKILSAVPADFVGRRHGFTLQRFCFQSKVFQVQQLTTASADNLVSF